MVESRTQHAKRNLFFGMVNKVFAMIMPFLSRTALIYVLGMEYVGLNALVASILQVLNLADLGIGTAIVYALYEPVANDDVPVIRALMNYYRIVYRAIGGVIAVVGLVIMPFLPRLIHGAPPEGVNIYVLYLAYLGNTVISYLLFAYKQALPTAMQRVDVVSNVNTIISIVLNLAQVIALLLWANYYVYLFLIPASTILGNLIMSFYIDKTYARYRPQGSISIDQRKSIRKHVAGLTIQRGCVTTRNSLDSMFLSAFMGLTVAAIYDNYYMIMSVITSFLAVVSQAILPTVGNSIVTDSREKNYQDMRTMNFLYLLISGWCSSCLLCLYQPFMTLWAGSKGMLGFNVVVLLVLYFYALKMGDIITLYASGAGLWWENRWRAIAESVLNLILNYLFIQRWGVGGIVASTLTSLVLVNFGLGTGIIFKYYFKNGKIGEYFTEQFRYFLVTAAICFVAYRVCMLVPMGGIVSLLARGMVCAVVTAVLYVAVYYRNETFRRTIRWAMSVVRPAREQ